MSSCTPGVSLVHAGVCWACPEYAQVCLTHARCALSVQGVHLACPQHAQVCSEGSQVCSEHSQVCSKHSQVCSEGSQVGSEHSQVCSERSQVFRCAQHAQVCPGVYRALDTPPVCPGAFDRCQVCPWHIQVCAGHVLGTHRCVQGVS